MSSCWLARDWRREDDPGWAVDEERRRPAFTRVFWSVSSLVSSGSVMEEMAGETAAGAETGAAWKDLLFFRIPVSRNGRDLISLLSRFQGCDRPKGGLGWSFLQVEKHTFRSWVHIFSAVCLGWQMRCGRHDGWVVVKDEEAVRFSSGRRHEFLWWGKCQATVGGLTRSGLSDEAQLLS